MRRRLIFCVLCIGILFLTIPLVTTAAQVTHKVKRGDSIHNLAKKYHVSVSHLKSVNGLRSNKLSIGQMIVIRNNDENPGTRETRKGSSSKTIRAQARQETPAEPVISENDEELVEYKVKRGDTLDKIASKFNVEKDELIATNNLTSRKNRKLSPGKTILIPKVMEDDGDDGDTIVSFKYVPVKPWKNSEEKYMLVKVAKSFMGAPYKYGGNTLRGLDCSAYVKKIYEIFDVELPRSAREQFMVGNKISKEELSVGDLVFFKTRRYAKYPTHVGIFIGDGNFIHASSGKSRLGVKIDTLTSGYYFGAYIGATRIKGSTDGASGRGPEATQPVEKPSNNS
ncbi:MAG: D-gamma-glutamyl-meso-diaminopimelic acid endopeptidase CwlS precursor [Syntrophorhabdus sp. PtaB.Bin047]|jgi:cell wall-associated NlpC family hydrolase|nr:MAG: D-gamma-glutamyl-meso-diaminopimelic acid endopeptidase CwlS precursor [Syntrophorhabdus sp. PtaB.Bin047]